MVMKKQIHIRSLLGLCATVTRRCFLALLVTALLGATAFSAEPRAETPARVVRVLFIGNSYTYVNELPALVAQLLAPRGIRLEHESVTPGGATLEKQWKDGKALAAIQNGKWDFVVLQEQSMRPFRNREAMFSAAKSLHAEIAKAGAKTLLYETWAAKAVPDEQSKLTDAYDTLGRELGATVVPAGEAWKRGIAAGLELHGSDGRHPSRLGSYLAACVFARVISGQAIVGPPPQIVEKDKPWTWPKAAELETLQRLAEETWQAQKRDSLPPAAPPSNPLLQK